MKVALCLSGQVRTFRRCFPSQYKKLIAPFKSDVFIHTWMYSGSYFRDARHHHYTDDYDISLYEKYNTDEYLTDSACLAKLYKPKKLLIEKPEKQRFIDKSPKASFFNALMMYYSIYKANELRQQYEIELGFKYDLVIRCRFDLRVNAFDIKDAKPNIIYLAPNQLLKFDRISARINKPVEQIIEDSKNGFMPSDQFAAGSSEAMNYYSNLYNVWSPETHPTHPEGMLAKHLWWSDTYKPLVYDGFAVEIVRDENA